MQTKYPLQNGFACSPSLNYFKAFEKKYFVSNSKVVFLVACIFQSTMIAEKLQIPYTIIIRRSQQLLNACTAVLLTALWSCKNFILAT